jgi:alpha-D-ribose 1-methylphosphonate 5-triphosphate diphosphatase PhnM
VEGSRTRDIVYELVSVRSRGQGLVQAKEYSASPLVSSDPVRIRLVQRLRLGDGRVADVVLIHSRPHTRIILTTIRKTFAVDSLCVFHLIP